MPASTSERGERYRAGLCTTCGVKPHSAGRPRCDECHKDLLDRISRGEQPA